MTVGTYYTKYLQISLKFTNYSITVLNNLKQELRFKCSGKNAFKLAIYKGSYWCHELQCLHYVKIVRNNCWMHQLQQVSSICSTNLLNLFTYISFKWSTISNIILFAYSTYNSFIVYALNYHEALTD